VYKPACTALINPTKHRSLLITMSKILTINHVHADNFNIFDVNSQNNFYTNYSVQGRKNARSYMHQVTIGSDKFSFIAVDACLKPGPKRPFNFVGALDNFEIERLQNLMNKSRESEADYIIWFGHYPTSCIVAPNNGGVRSIIGTSLLVSIG
jgi:hypothetical protein